MEVSKVFDTEKQIIRYDNLGIARLIYQLPKMCIRDRSWAARTSPAA